MTDESKIFTQIVKPNSYEFGKASCRWKLYFEEAIDLRKKIDELKANGFIVIEENGLC